MRSGCGEITGLYDKDGKQVKDEANLRLKRHEALRGSPGGAPGLGGRDEDLPSVMTGDGAYHVVRPFLDAGASLTASL